VSGQDLRRRAAHTLADALIDIVGLDTGDGSDNGPMIPNIGMWGLKEFDALLVTLDGVPVGGPFNPELAQIPIEEIERVEVVKGPQGTLYGVSAFAGMIQVFTRGHEEGGGHLSLGGGSFEDKHVSAGLQHEWNGTTFRLSGGVLRSEGWQDRTSHELDRGSLTMSRRLGPASASLELYGMRDDQHWGTAMPYEAGAPVPGFEVDRNYAVVGARLGHQVWGGNARLAWPLNERLRVENTFGASRDRQTSIRSFPDPGAASGDTIPSEGVAIHPKQNVVFDDLRLVSQFKAGGTHELVTGGAITWGKVEADGEGFDIDFELSDPSSIPDLGAVPPGDLRSFSDKRTFAGVYAHDEWTPIRWITIGGGGRYDHTSETLHAQAQEQDGVSPLEVADDERTESAWSGNASALVRLLPHPTDMLGQANAYVNWGTAFKPAAPNLSEAEGAEILDPERTHSLEGGLKLRGVSNQVGLDVSWFDMSFANTVVAVLDTSGLPELTNAGRESFKGIETSLWIAPKAAPGLSLQFGYAHHDAKFVQFTFVTPDGQFRDVSGKFLELVPKELYNARVSYKSPWGPGGFVAVRHQGERPFNRRNTFFDDPFDEWDAGAWVEWKDLRLAVTGRNLGDSRHVVGESEIGDSQFYIAPPRRVSAELTWRLPTLNLSR
jgi:outer membrane receptor protein involved in Fe transport